MDEEKRKPVVYTDQHHENAYIDYQKLLPVNDLTHECPNCRGHGGWNIRVNAYKLPPGVDDTPENRHKYVHFRAQCQNCHGCGYVTDKQGDHIHKWKYIKNVGNCLNLYRCDGCGIEWEVDSSD